MAPEIDEPHLAAWRSLLNAHATMTARIEEALAEAGLPPLAWYDVLWPLYDGPLRMRDLAGRVVTISRSGLTRLVDRIEAAGLLERRAAEGDRRGTEVVITPEGKKLLRRMWPVYAGVLRECFVDALSESEAALLRDALGRVADSR